MKVTGTEEAGGGDRNPPGLAGPFCGLTGTFQKPGTCPGSGHILGAKGADAAGWGAGGRQPTLAGQGSYGGWVVAGP